MDGVEWNGKERGLDGAQDRYICDVTFFRADGRVLCLSRAIVLEPAMEKKEERGDFVCPCCCVRLRQS